MRETKSSGVDWIGEMPSSWKVAPLKYGASCSSDLSTYTADDSKEFLALENVESWTGRLVGLDERPDSVDSSVSVFSETDVLFGKLRPYLAKVCRPGFRGVCSTELLCVSPMSYCCDYLFWLLISKGFIDVINAESYGVKMPRTSWAQMGAHYCPVPPLSEQQAIAGHLDAETAKIDQAMTLLRRELETLEQFKKSVIHEAVTKGLDPTVPMKPSGVEWIGDIPMNWEAKKLKFIASFGSGTTPDSGDYSYYDGGDIPWIQSGDLYEVPRISSTDKNVTAKAVRELSVLSVYKAPFVVVAMYGASVGNTSLSVIDACMNQACCYIQATRVASNEYLFYAITSAKSDLMSKAQGGTQPNISQIVLKNQWVPCPPLVEQKRIVEALEQRLNDLDHAIIIKRRQVSLLKQQRQALIFEYVTGKRRVNEVA